MKKCHVAELDEKAKLADIRVLETSIKFAKEKLAAMKEELLHDSCDIEKAKQAIFYQHALGGYEPGVLQPWDYGRYLIELKKFPLK